MVGSHQAVDARYRAHRKEPSRGSIKTSKLNRHHNSFCGTVHSHQHIYFANSNTNTIIDCHAPAHRSVQQQKTTQTQPLQSLPVTIWVNENALTIFCVSKPFAIVGATFIRKSQRPVAYRNKRYSPRAGKTRECPTRSKQHVSLGESTTTIGRALQGAAKVRLQV